MDLLLLDYMSESVPVQPRKITDYPELLRFLVGLGMLEVEYHGKPHYKNFDTDKWTINGLPFRRARALLMMAAWRKGVKISRHQMKWILIYLAAGTLSLSGWKKLPGKCNDL